MSKESKKYKRLKTLLGRLDSDAERIKDKVEKSPCFCDKFPCDSEIFNCLRCEMAFLIRMVQDSYREAKELESDK